MGRAMERLAANNHYNPNSYCDVVLIWDFAPASLSSMLNLLTENKMQTVCGSFSEILNIYEMLSSAC